MWCPPVITWFINPINYSYITYKPELLDLLTNLANYGAPLCRWLMDIYGTFHIRDVDMFSENHEKIHDPPKQNGIAKEGFYWVSSQVAPLQRSQ